MVRAQWRMPLCERCRNSASTRPSVPNLAIRACPCAALAVVALLDFDRCQPSCARVWQSITSAREAQPSLPVQIRARSVDHLPFGAAAADGTAWMRGRMPTARLQTCHPLSRSEASNGCPSWRHRFEPDGRRSGRDAEPAAPSFGLLNRTSGVRGLAVDAREPGHGPIAEGRLLLDHFPDRLGEPRIDLRRGFQRLAEDRAPGNAGPRAELGDRHGAALVQEALQDAYGEAMPHSCASKRACNRSIVLPDRWRS